MMRDPSEGAHADQPKFSARDHSVGQDKVDDDSMLGQFIPLHYHALMLMQRARMTAFKEAIAKTVPLSGRVLELGGGTGVMSFFAARRAAKVYCAERIPHVARAARQYLELNGAAERVVVVEGDARTYLPPEPVDVVICEMLHTGLLREKQLEVIASFKRRYATTFGGRMPTFLPEAAILAVQPVQQEFDFNGYHAPMPLFRVDAFPMKPLGATVIYSSLEYRNEFPTRFQFERVFEFHDSGSLNALRFITKNLVAILPQEKRSIDWDMNDLIVPFARPMSVEKGERKCIRFEYDAGDSLPALMRSMMITH